MKSLRLRLILFLGALCFGVWLAVTAMSALAVREETGQLCDTQLAKTTDTLVAAMRHDLGGVSGHGGEPVAHTHAYALPMTFQVWTPGGRLWRASEDAPATRLAGSEGGYGNVEVGGEAWRVFTRRDPESGYTVHVANRLEARRALIREVVGATLQPLLLAAPLLLLGIWIGISRALAPLGKIAGELSVRDYDHLEPVRTGNVPQEVQPLVSELNRMLGRLTEAFGRFDRFAQDAAHELQSPVSAIRAQAEAGLAASDEAGRRHALEQVKMASVLCGTLVDQLLLLARLEPEGSVCLEETLDLRGLAGEVLAELAPAAMARGLEVSFAEGGPVPVRGNEELVGILIRNLIQNAARSTPAGGRIHLEVGADRLGPYLAVQDTGPGIPPRERARVLQRFCRLPGTIGAGYGIGLSIVQRIAEVHRASVSLLDGEGGNGLKVLVSFGPGASAERREGIAATS